MKYPNVVQTDKFHPFLGDTAMLIKNMQENKYLFYEHITDALKPHKYDIKFVSQGNSLIYFMMSTKAVKEFVDLIPSKIDRSPMFRRYFGKMNPNAFINSKTTQNWKERRNATNTIIGFNYASRYVSLMNECLDEQIKKWKPGQAINFSDEINEIAFKIICIILFGKETLDKIGQLNHLSLDGKVTPMKFYTFFSTLNGDILNTMQEPLGNIFPFLIDYNLIKPYSVVQKNCNELQTKLLEYLEKYSDEN